MILSPLLRRYGWLLLFLASVGCTEPVSTTPPAVRKDIFVPMLQKPVPLVVQQSIAAMGNWDGVLRIRAQVLLNDYKLAPKPYINKFSLRLDLGDQMQGTFLKAAAATPSGPFYIQRTPGGPSEQRVYRPNPKLQESVSQAFGTLMHRISGPWNIGRATACTPKPREVRIVDGDKSQIYLRVAVLGDKRAKAYYFDPSDHLLRYITEGADQPNRKGTVTRYHYTILPNGLVFPNRIQVVRIGEQSLLGVEKVLQIEFSDIECLRTIE